jgi:sterol desaturase/sphingolipid hydroxylase (fatty acid hydroxylase superfamily)
MSYAMWLAVVSVPFVVLERLVPRDASQGFWRPGLLRDFGFFVLNGHFVGVGLAIASGWLWSFAQARWGLPEGGLFSVQPVASGWPMWLQFLVAFVVLDLVQWLTHVTLHRVPWLWEFHKVHHAITKMDFWGSLRFHWMEVVVYRTTQFLPLLWLGAAPEVLMALAVVSTVIGHMNHANVRLRFGPLAYLINSPHMHLWHHVHESAGPMNRNFGINLAIWDWLFGTAYLPKEEPARLGFSGIESFPDTLVGEMVWPVELPASGERSTT